jgi:hypothetical protein
VTVEKLGIILAGQDRGILIKRDELAGWIGQMEKYAAGRGSSADRAFWLQAFDGGPFTVDRVSRADLMINNLSASIIGGIQPARLAELTGLTADGLLQRFLPALLSESTFPIDRTVTSEAERYSAIIKAIVGIAPQKLLLTDDAVEIMETLRRDLHNLERASGGLAEGLQGFIGKLPGIAGSLALILTVAADPDSAMGARVQAPVVEDVSRLMHEFILPHGFEFYRTTEAASGGERLQRIASYILTGGKSRILPSNLAANVAGMRGITLWELNQRVSPLVSGGWLVAEERGPITRAWKVNPKVHQFFSERTRQEDDRKAAIATLMNSPRTTEK